MAASLNTCREQGAIIEFVVWEEEIQQTYTGLSECLKKACTWYKNAEEMCQKS